MPTWWAYVVTPRAPLGAVKRVLLDLQPMSYDDEKALHEHAMHPWSEREPQGEATEKDHG